ncbi:hypothetical protein OKA04_08690 [Luteolibacter flavescens]|uniref:Uncharacterized protein n=1 Tax=Luteolibacter flavescens TaxID=1859460 RepID=A0ABT3FMK3_9BACT|nr:hypothetical protein [Luteolibacter flavescens]MCW1884802.1 hypothetical protein [Luteolibacter flavescens]
MITLSLMVLMTILAIGLLSLSSISLRSNTQGDARSEAQANARLALMLAIGELQKSLGPDQAITANAEIHSDTPGKPRLMGVWKSWDLTSSIQAPGGSPDYDGEKENRFKGWMVSTATPRDATSLGFADSTWEQDAITLADTTSYGGTLPAAGALRAGRVSLAEGSKESGGYAWHVSDESQKSRILLFRDPSQSDTLARQRSLLAGHRPYTAMLGGDLGFLGSDSDANAFATADLTGRKVTGLNQGELTGPGGIDQLKQIRDDVTPYSLGVLADVRLGGLKKDLSSMFELPQPAGGAPIPTAFNNKGLYASTHAVGGESDPQWTRLSSCYNTFKKLTTPDTRPTFNQAPLENVMIPSVGSKPVQPKYFTPGPVIAKVQVLFSLLTRPPHHSADNGQDGQLHMIYTPIVTLYNPYNVRISFDMLEVSFQSLPLGFNFQLDGVALNGGNLIPFNELYDQGRTQGGIAKSIVLKISNWRSFDTTVTESNGGKAEAQIEREADRESSDPKNPVVMEPGQTLLCSPFIDPTSQFGRTGSPNAFFDFGNQLTRSIKTKPGFFGNTVGYDIDWLNRAVVTYPRRPKNTAIGVTCGVANPTLGGNASFEVAAKITVNGTTRNYGGIQMIYPTLSDLEKLMKQTRFSTTALDSFVANEGGGDAMISRHANAKPFALFTASARTTSGGVNEAGVRSQTSAPGNLLVNGIHAGKPFLFNNAAIPLNFTNLKNEKAGAQSYELSLEGVTRSTVSKLLQSDARNRTRFITGNTPDQGIKSGSMLEVPGGPMLAISDFRRTNVLASGYAPYLTQPIGNSTVPPVMTTSSAWQAGTGYRLLDHSFLANHALYDSFYFSTFATDGDRNPEKCFTDFMDESRPLLSQSFTPHLAVGKSLDEVKSDLFSGGMPAQDTYQKAAAYQMVRGAFNVNSTNVKAWKARLAALRESSVPVFDLAGTGLTTVGTENTPLLSMTMPNAGLSNPAEPAMTDTAKETMWSGFRQLSDAQLDELAVRIVEQVKERGPFLSMSDFVNRRIGSNSEKTRRGALEAAIEQAKLNENAYASQIPITTADIGTSDYGFATPEVVTGNPAAGAPGWITQGDILKLLEPAATVRSDTFVIRVCGEAVRDGHVTRAYAEAVVQRMPEYIDPADEPHVNATTSSNDANKTFGRRLEMISFRWLSTAEI